MLVVRFLKICSVLQIKMPVRIDSLGMLNSRSVMAVYKNIAHADDIWVFVFTIIRLLRERGFLRPCFLGRHRIGVTIAFCMDRREVEVGDGCLVR